MKVNVPEFLETFVKTPTPVDVVVKFGSTNMVYVGGSINWGAFTEHLKAFKDMYVDSVSVKDGRLIVSVVSCKFFNPPGV